METRDTIKNLFDNERPDSGLYEELKSCLIPNYDKIPLGPQLVQIEDEIDLWFKGVIHSLFYRPNKRVLVLVGKPGIGKSHFFANLLPLGNDLFSDTYEKTSLYYKLITHMEFTLSALNIPAIEDFTIRMPYTDRPSAEKRLCSYCSTAQEWRFPQRKMFTILHLNSIDTAKYNSINKYDLWSEIFNKFKP